MKHIISETTNKGKFYLMAIIEIPMFGSSASMTSKRDEAKVFDDIKEAEKHLSIVGKRAELETL